MTEYTVTLTRWEIKLLIDQLTECLREVQMQGAPVTELKRRIARIDELEALLP